MSKKNITIIVIIIIAIFIAIGYWLYMDSGAQGIPFFSKPTGNTTASNGNGNIFSPLNGNGTQNQQRQPITNRNTSNTSSTSTTISTPTSPIPSVRQLSTNPVGGMGASTTASSSIVRWIDRGTGYIYQADSNSLNILELSNTTVPMVYQSFWNHNTSAFIFRSLNGDSNTITNFFAQLSPVIASSTLNNSNGSTTANSPTLSARTPFTLKGVPLPSDTSEIAVSPTGDKIFTLTSGIGYVSQFDGSKINQIFTTPLSEVNVEWPVDTTIAITTKGNSALPGFLYFVNSKTGVFSGILANINGLDTLTNKDATEVLFTSSIDSSIITYVHNVKSGTDQELAFNTLPEKCVWSAINKSDLICAVPSKIPSGDYPEAWYKGTAFFNDSLWEINTSTGVAHQISNLLSTAGTSIDAENLVLDPKENILYFINKKDLSLWSVRLNS